MTTRDLQYESPNRGAKGNPGPAGADGVVQSVVAGSGVTVDNTDPANPIVAASGGSAASSYAWYSTSELNVTHTLSYTEFTHTADRNTQHGADVDLHVVSGHTYIRFLNPGIYTAVIQVEVILPITSDDALYLIPQAHGSSDFVGGFMGQDSVPIIFPLTVTALDSGSALDGGTISLGQTEVIVAQANDYFSYQIKNITTNTIANTAVSARIIRIGDIPS